MRSFLVFVYFTISWAYAQNGRSSSHTNGQHNNGHGWDIRLAVPGEPGSDYPTLGSIPRTSFTCAGKSPGYYADVEANCQVFRVCTAGSTYGFQSFLCPNGTLFNQAVFVCDWWMHVKCQRSQIFTTNNQQFGNLRLGPQLMKDVKKMLTHPMKNPLDRTMLRGNLVIMQDYKPPSGQLFPNGALISGSDRTPKQIQLNSYFNNDNTFTASTISPTYVPALNSVNSYTQSAEVFQRQRQNQYGLKNIQNTRNFQGDQIMSNGHAGRFTQSNYQAQTNSNGYTRPTQTNNPDNVQYNQNQITNNFRSTKTLNTENSAYPQNGQIRQNIQYSTNIIPSQQTLKQSQFETEYSKQQYNYNENSRKQPYTYKTPLPQFGNEIISKVGNEAKQNLVSSTTKIPTVTTRAPNFNRIVQAAKPRNPSAKSRVVFKTWIVKPSKAAKLIAEPTPYTYDKPTKPDTEQVIIATTPYLTQKTTLTQSGRLVSESEPYVYNKPSTIAVKQIITTANEPQVSYLPPTTPTRPLSGRLRSTMAPTQASLLYIAPTTYKPSSRYYIPPSDGDVLSRQYLSPTVVPIQNAKLLVAPSSPLPFFTTTNNDIQNPTSFTVSKNSSTNNYNLTFSDILTKEKLDITVNDIVKDTNNILNTATPENFNELIQEEQIDDSYLPPESNIDETSQTPTISSKRSRLILTPSTDLEPPVETFNNNYNNNQLANLPFYKEPALNTIERTVSIKITIPEKIASYLLTSCNETDYDKLEILNTGSSNYLVLTNEATKTTNPSFIPIGKLVFDKNSNISRSQALVFSFLADSLNVAKDYSNIAQQNVLASTTAQPQFQNINSAELAQITNQISDLTSSQYSQSNRNQANIISTVQSTTTTADKNSGTTKYTNNLSQNQFQQIQNAQYNIAPTEQIRKEPYALRYQNVANNQNATFLGNQNQIYSGQLYQLSVPEVTNHLHNSESSAKLIQMNPLKNLEAEDLQRGFNQNAETNSGFMKQSSAEVEIVQSQTLPNSHPAKLQLASSSESGSYNSQENSEQSLSNFLSANGISARLQDKIVGIIQHPTEENKYITYKKNQAYNVYTKNDNAFNEVQSNAALITNDNIGKEINGKLIQTSSGQKLVSFQFIPSVSYQLDDEKQQQKILNVFQINELGSPKKINTNDGYQINNPNERNDVLSSIDYSVVHSAKQINDQTNDISKLYAGPSSYSAPQGYIGNLQTKNAYAFNSKIEELDEFNGYSKSKPLREFTF